MSKKNDSVISDLISQAEAARIRGVTRAAIRDLIRRGRLRSFELGGRELVYRSEVEGFEKEKPGPKVEES
jgi:excisionase family DNA binding protein